MRVKIMKTTLNKLRRDETGQAFILALIMLLLGGLIMAPLLGFMGTGLKAGQAYEERMAELYAADAGIEDAILKIKNGQVPDQYPLTVNGKDVWVQVPPDGDADPMITFFIDLGILKDTQGNYNKNRPHQDWLMVYAPLEGEGETGMCSEYRITAFYVAGGQPQILSTGFWINGYDYNSPLGTATVIPWDEDGSVTGVPDSHLQINLDDDPALTPVDIDGDGIDDVDEADIITQPLIDPGYTNFEDNEPLDDGVTEIVDLWGRAFIWKWKPAQGPRFGKGVICRTQRFALYPSIALSAFPPNVAWLGTKENSIHISWSGELIQGIEGILAEATSATGKSTTVLSYVFAQQDIPGGPVAITVLTWEAEPQ